MTRQGRGHSGVPYAPPPSWISGNPLLRDRHLQTPRFWNEIINSPCKTSHISGLPLPGLRKPGPPLKTKRVADWQEGRGFPCSAFPAPPPPATVKWGDNSTLGQALLGSLRELTEPQGQAWRRAHSRGSAPLGAWLDHAHHPASFSKRVGSKGGRGGRGRPLPGVPAPWGRPARCAQLCGTRTQSPVLIPWLLRSWTMSWVRPGQRPALSTPMFPGDPGPASRGRPQRPLQTPLGAPFWTGGRRRGWCGPTPGPRRPRPASPAPPPLPASTLQNRAGSAICWP